MAVRFHCPHCQGLLSISSRRIGAVVPCPTCNAEILVPDHDEYDPAFRATPVAAFSPPKVEDPPLKFAGGGADSPPVLLAEREPAAVSEPPPVNVDCPTLELRFLDGRQELKPLNRTTPVTIGAQSFNDVCVAHAEVSPLHCRIGWNKTGYEVTAATSKGVEVNGAVVTHAYLRAGDVIRIGPLDVLYHEESPEDVPASKQPEQSVAKSPRAPEPSLFEGPVLVESATNLPVAELDEDAYEEKLPSLREPKPTAAAPTGRRRRPGEEEVLRSPWILGLTVGSGVILLAAATIYFLMGREQRSQALEQAETELANGQYAQAIERFEEYLKRYPGHRTTRAAQIGLAKARVQKEISGGAPAWEVAWERLNELVQSHKGTADYRDLQPLVRDYAEQIAIGSARGAELNKNESLLEVSSKARNLMENSADPDTPQTGPLELIRTATEQAKLAIAKHAQLDAAVAKMQAALAAGQPIEALSLRAGLLRQFPEFAKESRLRAALKSALESEEKKIAVQGVDRPALTDELPAVHAVLPALHARSRSEETSLGQVVFVTAQDSVYAVDTITGEVVWRRVIGTEPPFFPVAVRGAVAGVLLYDGHYRELVLCKAESGRTIWRQPLADPPLVAPPCLDEGQIFLSLRGGRLARLDLETGRLTAQLQFSQELAGAPVVAPDSAHLFVAGDHGLIYTLRRRPLECVALTFTDHAPQTVRAPLLTLGKMLLVCENDRGDSALLRLWDATNAATTLTEVGEPQRVAGAVYEAPILRGSHLVVSGTGERLAAFAVSDEPGRMGLAPIGQYRLQDGYGGPQYVMLGPDRQFWVCSTAFRKFEIAAESLRMEPNAVAVGLTSQPLQAIGETFFVGRRPFFAEGVVFTNIDRDRMTGTWRLTVGARPRELLPSATGGATLITETAAIYRVGGTRLSQGGIELRNGAELEIPADVRSSPFINRLSDGRVAVAVRGATPKLWLVDAEGRVSNGPAFERPPECAPVLLDDGIAWPVAGRLQLRPLSGSQRFDEWRAPVSESDSAAWQWLVQTGGREFLGYHNDGTLRRFQVRTGEVPHVAEAASVKLDILPIHPPVLVGEELACVTGPHAVQWVNVRSLDAADAINLPGDVRGIWPAGDRLLTQLVDGTVCSLTTDREAKVVWTAALGEVRLTGAPFVTEAALWLAGERGDVLAVSRETGKSIERRRAPQGLGLGVRDIAGTMWAIAVDGTLYRVSDLPEVKP